jgi:flagellin-like hook-associated protein FlgL
MRGLCRSPSTATPTKKTELTALESYLRQLYRRRTDDRLFSKKRDPAGVSSQVPYLYGKGDLSIKDSALRLASTMENELIQIRADQMEAADGLINRINGVANNVKELRAELGTVKSELDTVAVEVGTVKENVARMDATQTQMLGILIDIQRRLPS